LTATTATFTASGGGYLAVSGCRWTGTRGCPYSWGNCSCGQGLYELHPNPRNIVSVTYYVPPFATEASKKKTHHAHLIERHIRSRRPDRATRFKSKAHVWSTPAGAPRRYL